MIKPVVPPTLSTLSLSDGAKIILKHFQDNKIPQLSYELPATLEALFSDPEKCEHAQEELFGLGLVDLDPALSLHIPVRSRVRATAITREGELYIAKNQI
jgi:hypothetical protein